MHSTTNRKLGRKRAVIQKCQSDIQKVELKQDICENRYKSKIKNGQNHLTSLSCLLIIFKISDNRRRDIDGMVATVFDSLVQGGVIEDDGIREIPTAITTFIKVKKGEEGFDTILIER